MRLLSNFYDYYDCMAKYDEHRDVIYYRKTEKIEKQTGILSSEDFRRDYIYTQYSTWILGFCNQLFVGIPIWNEDRQLTNVLWKKEEINQYLYTIWQNRQNTRQSWRGDKHPNTYEEIFKRVKERTPERNVCIWVEYPYTIVYHPCLRELFFQKIIPPAQAWMQLNSWHDNVARPIQPIPEIPDKIMAEAKGFDRYSFKKSPTKKRK